MSGNNPGIPEIGPSANTQSKQPSSSCSVEEGPEQLTHEQVRSPAGLSARAENKAEGNKELRMRRRGLPLDGCDCKQAEACFIAALPGREDRAAEPQERFRAL